MKKFKLSLFLDFLTIFTLCFAISFVWFQHIFRNAFLSFIFSVCVGLSVVFLQSYFQRKKQKQLQIKSDIESHLNQCADTLLFNTFEENCSFLKEMLSDKYTIEIRNKFLLLSDKENSIALFPAYENKKLTQDNILQILKSVKQLNLTRIVILCYEYDINVSTISANYKVKTFILNKIQTYHEVLCVFNKFPEKNNLQKINEKITLSFILRNAVSKNKMKTYFWCGLFLLFASMFIKYNLYYVIFSSLMFVMCLLCFIFSKFNYTSKSEIL